MTQPLGSWLRDLGQEIFSLDSRLLRTLRWLLFVPGEATRRYLAGQRQPQTPPLRLYIGLSAVAIAAMSATGMVQVDGIFRDLPASEIENIERVFGIDDFADPAFRAAFDRRFNLVFPLLNLLTPIGLALALKLVMPRTVLQAHGVTGLHLGSVMVLSGLVLVPAAMLSQSVAVWAAGLVSLWLAVYVWLALRRVYPAGRGRSAVRWLALAVAYVVLINVITLGTMAIVFLSV